METTRGSGGGTRHARLAGADEAISGEMTGGASSGTNKVHFLDVWSALPPLGRPERSGGGGGVWGVGVAASPRPGRVPNTGNLCGP